MLAEQKPKQRVPGCLVAILVVVIIVGGLLLALSISASAAVSAPALLTVYNPSVTLNNNPATSGTILKAGDEVETGVTGRASIQYGDGSVTKLAESTTITISAATLNKDGSIHQMTLKQQIGRTLHTVQKLGSGDHFEVDAPNGTVASVRGTIYEAYVKPDHSSQYKAFKDTIHVTGTNQQLDITTGNLIDGTTGGQLGSSQAIPNDRTDPFVPELEAQNAAAQGTTHQETVAEGHIKQGETQQQTVYYAGGGDFKAALGYPGSSMDLTVIDPAVRVGAASQALPHYSSSSSTPQRASTC